MCRHQIVCMAAFICSLAFPALCIAQNNSGVSVLVRQQRSSAGEVVYHYTVVNRDKRKIVAIDIGRDEEHDRSELTELPIGWTFDEGLPATSATSPPGWEVTLITNEESQYFDIEWRTGDATAIPRGGKKTGYSVILSKPHPQYMNSHFTVFFSDATTATGTLRAEQTHPAKH